MLPFRTDTDLVEHIIVQHAIRYGIRTDFHGPIPPTEVQVIGEEMREHLFALGFNSRQRAVLDLAVEYLREHDISDSQARIYGHEAITPMALALRGRFPRFIGTEYARSAAEKAALFPIMHGDVCQSE